MTTPDGLVHALRAWPGFLDRVARTATRISDPVVADDEAEEEEPQERPGAEAELPLPDED